MSLPSCRASSLTQVKYPSRYQFEDDETGRTQKSTNTCGLRRAVAVRSAKLVELVPQNKGATLFPSLGSVAE